MSTELKAIETHYKGYRFRSRLEARWAVFFDALNITWEYEPEGYEFSDGTRYLPDFQIKGIGKDYFIEVKPLKDSYEWGGSFDPIWSNSIDPITAKKADLLAQGMETEVLVVAGTPHAVIDRYGTPTWGYVCVKYIGSQIGLEASVCENSGAYFHYCLHSLPEFLSKEGYDTSWFDGSYAAVRRLIDLDRDYYTNKYQRIHHNWGHCGVAISDLVLNCTNTNPPKLLTQEPNMIVQDRLIRAYTASTEARFEFGEIGRKP